jgi:hypothetical protein
MRLLLASSQQLLLGVADHTNNLAIFLDLIEIFLNFLLSNFIFPLKTGLSESLFLRLGPLFFLWEETEIRQFFMLEHGFIVPLKKFGGLLKIRPRGNAY